MSLGCEFLLPPHSSRIAVRPIRVDRVAQIRYCLQRIAASYSRYPLLYSLLNPCILALEPRSERLPTTPVFVDLYLILYRLHTIRRAKRP